MPRYITPVMFLILPAVAFAADVERRWIVRNPVTIRGYVLAETERGVSLLTEGPPGEFRAIWDRVRSNEPVLAGAVALFKTVAPARDTLVSAQIADPRNPVFTDLAAYPEIGGISAVESAGAIHVAFSSVSGGQEQIYYMRGIEGRWEPPVLVSPSQCPFPRTMPAISVREGRVSVVYSGYDGEDYELYCVIGDGRQFTPEIQATHNDGVADFAPRFSVGADGAERLSWTRSGAQGSREISSPVGQGGAIQDVAEPAPLPVTLSAMDVNPNVFCGFGDSITEGNGTSGYFPQLESQLARSYGPAQVINEGVGGEETPAGLARISSVLASRRPAAVLLMEGTNDVTRNTSSKTIAYNLFSMIGKCRDAGSIALLATLIPRGPEDGFDPDNVQTQRVNQEVRVLIIDQRIPYTDMFDAFAADPDYRDNLMADHVHPNGRGFDVMGQQWYQAISTLPPASPSSLTAQQLGNKKQASLTWTAGRDSDIAGYIIIYGTMPNVYDHIIDAGPRTSYRVADLEYGVTYYFRTRCYDKLKNLSGLSPEASVAVTK